MSGMSAKLKQVANIELCTVYVTMMYSTKPQCLAKLNLLDNKQTE